MIVVEPGMATPVLPVVIEALQMCGASSVHERTLELLNLYAIDLLPGEYVIHIAGVLQSVAMGWIECTVDAIASVRGW